VALVDVRLALMLSHVSDAAGSVRRGSCAAGFRVAAFALLFQPSTVCSDLEGLHGQLIVARNPVTALAVRSGLCDWG
jgi:hypothetical protein